MQFRRTLLKPSPLINNISVALVWTSTTIQAYPVPSQNLLVKNVHAGFPNGKLNGVRLARKNQDISQKQPGTSLARRKKTSSAARYRELSLKLKNSPKDDKLYRMRGWTLYELGRYRDAVRDFTRAIELNPDCYRYILDRADILNKLEYFNGAYSDYQKVLRIEPKQGIDYYYRALASRYLDMPSETIQNCDKAISLGYKVHKVYRLKGKTYYSSGHFKKALEQFKIAAAQTRTPTTYRNLGRCYRRLGKLQESIEALNVAKSLEPTGGEIYLELAITNTRLNKLTEAKKNYQIWRKLKSAESTRYPTWKSFVMYCEADKKIDYYTRIIFSSKTRNAAPVYERAILFMQVRQYRHAANDMEHFLSLSGWGGKSGVTAASIAYMAFRLCGRSWMARKVRKRAFNNLTEKKWPFPLFQYVTEQITKRDLDAIANTIDKKTQAKYFIALNSILHRDTKTAYRELTWIKQHGDRGLDEHGLAMVELEGLEHRLKIQGLK